MAGIGLSVFDESLHLTNLWLKELAGAMGWPDRYQAYHALRAVLHALRDRLTVQEAVHLGAQLPMVVRGFYYDGWHPAGTPVRERSKEEFLAHIRTAFTATPEIDAEAVARAVFALIERHVTAGEVRQVVHILPAEVRALWPPTVQS